MPSIDPNFRANPDRSIQIFGEFNDEMVHRISGQILHLRQQAENEPITIFINSNGGSIRCLDHIQGLLKTKGASGSKPRIITVAVGCAGSAAANMLTLGDYAISYPTASIHYHGVRYSEVDVVTVESASSMAAQLQNTNHATAAKLARAATERLAFHYARLKDEFAGVGKTITASEIECFALCLKKHLSVSGDRIVDKALKRWRSLRELSDTVLARARKGGKKGILFEATVLKGVIDFEVKKNSKNADWVLGEGGIYQIVNDFLLLRDYDIGRHVSLAKTILERFSGAFLSAEEIAKLGATNADGTPDANAMELGTTKMQNIIKPFCYFTASIWQGLQEDENPLSPKDAYWLGAIDEVYGTKLPCMRQLAEADSPEQTSLPGVAPTGG